LVISQSAPQLGELNVVLGAPPILGNKGTFLNCGYLETSSEHATMLSDSFGLSYMGLYTALNRAVWGSGPMRLYCPTGVDNSESWHGCGAARAIGARKSARMSVVGKIIVNELDLICELGAWFAWPNFAP